MADAPDLGSGSERIGGSSPLARTNSRLLALPALILLLASLAAVKSASLLTNIPPEPAFEQLGFSTLSACGQNGTVGGGDARPTVVRTAKEFQSACERLDIKDKKVRDTTRRVVLVANDIDLGELANQKPGGVLTNVGIVRIRPHTTILSTGPGATILRGTLEIHSSWDIIIRNLKFRDLWEFDPTGKYDKLGWDFVRITRAGDSSSHHVWVDHCDFGKAYDGQLDIVHGSDCVTVSWCRFAGDDRGPHKKTMLIGHSSGDNAASKDRGRLNVTLHHCWFENIEDRAPRARFGNIHAFNNFIDGAQFATISVRDAVTLVENCVYRDVKCATSFSHAKDSALHEKGGTICIVNSRNEKPRAAPVPAKAEERFEEENDFKSNADRANLQFNPVADFPWQDRNTLPYKYSADATDGVPNLVRQYSGVGKLKL
jgi:pectate lyase